VFADLDDDALGERIAARTLELIDIPSESRDEARIAEHVLGVWRDAGVPVRDAGDTAVVAELPGTGGGPTIVLAGHLDTVPAQGNRPGRREGDVVLGLGAADMKAADATIIEVAIALAAAPVAANVLCVLFGREELPIAESCLTPLLARDEALRSADLALVMEPTDNAIHAGCLGNIFSTWTFHGRSGHSARPWLADNAIERAARGISRLTETAPPDERQLDGLPFTEVIGVTQIHGGIADNVVPDEVVCHVNYRYAPDRSAADAEAHLTRLCTYDGETLEITSNSPSAPVSATHPLVQRLVAAGDLAVAPKQAWTPVAEFTSVGVPAVNFGPGDPAFAHRRDEQVSLDALVRCGRTLERFLCG
jgi:succinyl-diaminopimelate desuccinylase